MSPPLDVVRDVASLGVWPLPTLSGIVEAPSVRPDGTLLTSPGYDAATRTLYVPAEGLVVPAVPAHPTDENVRAAADLLQEVVADFPFDSQASRANCLAAMITPVLRPMIDGPIPLVLFDKPQAGTGATLLAEIVSTIATGRSAATMAAPRDDEGWRKEITSLLMRGSSLVVIDNVVGRLYAPSLAAAITARTWEDRLLGRSAMVSVPQRAVWVATGNNIQLGGDLPRRCYWIRLDAHRARP